MAATIHSGGDAGRACARTLTADDPVDLAAARDAGFEGDDIVCALRFGAALLFGPG